MTASSRPRVYCRTCGRSIAVTFNKRTGEMYARRHVVSPYTPCPGSNRTYSPRHPVHWEK